MKFLLMINTIISLLIFSAAAYADCRGCCSHHGGVVCSGGVTQCADGTSLSSKCRNKGCNKCGYASPPPATRADCLDNDGDSYSNLKIKDVAPGEITDFEKYLGLYIWKEDGIIYIDDYPPISMRRRSH